MAYAAIASLAAQGVSQINSSIAQSASYKIQEINSRVQAKHAETQGKAAALDLTVQFNKMMASNAVMSAAQGRSGGSVEAVASAAEAQYEWDMDYTALSSEIQKSGYDAQAAQYKLASKSALVGGTISALSGVGIKGASSLYSIGGSTRKPQKLSSDPTDMQF